MDDRQILQLLQQRDECAIDALQQRFGPRLYTMALNLTGSRRDAEECVSDTLMRVWNTVPPKHPEPLAPYVLRIGRNIALNRLRANTAQKRSGYELSLEELSGCISAPAADSEALGQALNDYLDTLNRTNRIIFLRRYWFGDAVKDIAAVLRMTENAVSVRLSRMRDGLKNHLSEEGFFYE